jgi:hypothetical protein
MSKKTEPEMQYHTVGEPLAEQQSKLDAAYALLFEEVLKRRSAISVPHHHVAPTDSTLKNS